MGLSGGLFRARCLSCLGVFRTRGRVGSKNRLRTSLGAAHFSFADYTNPYFPFFVRDRIEASPSGDRTYRIRNDRPADWGP